MLKIGIIIYQNVAEMDFVGPLEVLSDVNKIQESSTEVYLIAQTKDVIKAFNGMMILPAYDFSSAPDLDVLVVPGGKGRMTEMYNPFMREFILRQEKCAKYITSVCTGAFILAEAGLLNGKKATTFHHALKELDAYPAISIEKKKIVDAGRIITAAGVTSGLELGFYLLKILFDEKLAKEVASFMEYEVDVDKL